VQLSALLPERVVAARLHGKGLPTVAVSGSSLPKKPIGMLLSAIG
jgi:hypothetical protein